jgi:hypothetical protein
MFGDIEEHAFGAVKLDLEAAGPVAGLVHVMRAAQRLDPVRELLDVVDQDAEMVQAGVVETFADLVGLEPQDRQIDRAVAQVVAIFAKPLQSRRISLTSAFRVGD